MLPKKYRIQKNKEFKKIFRRSKKFETENFSFRFAKKQNAGCRTQNKNSINHKLTKNSDIKKPSATHYLPPTKFGFVVSNKIDKRAARRNGLKRRLRVVIGESLNNIKPGFDVIILVKKQPKYPYKYEEIKKEVLEGLRKINLISNYSNCTN